MQRNMRGAILALGAIGLALAGATGTASAQERQTDDSFRWTGRAVEGQWIFVRNLNGNVRMEATGGNQIEVRAIKRWRRGDPDAVRIQVARYGPGDRDVVVCALWGSESVCREDEYRNRGSGNRSRSNDVSVEFIVAVPRGLNLRSETVNGSVNISGATGQVRANSVNGNINATSTGGPVVARAVNGNVHATMGSARGSDDLSYTSVNGNVLVEFSGDLDAELEMSTVNGGFETNFPLALKGRINPRHIRATLGKGGRQVKLSTVNGNVELKRLRD